MNHALEAWFPSKQFVEIKTKHMFTPGFSLSFKFTIFASYVHVCKNFSGRHMYPQWGIKIKYIRKQLFLHVRKSKKKLINPIFAL